MTARQLATVLCLALGGLAIVEGLVQLENFAMLGMSVGSGILNDFHWATSLALILASLVVPVLLLGLGRKLLLSPPQRFLDKASAPSAEAALPATPADVVTMILRVGVVLIGLYLACSVTPTLVNYIYSTALVDFSILRDPSLRSQVSLARWTSAITILVKAAISVYFILGAPGLTERLLRRIRNAADRSKAFEEQSKESSP